MFPSACQPVSPSARQHIVPIKRLWCTHRLTWNQTEQIDAVSISCVCHVKTLMNCSMANSLSSLGI